MRQIFYYKCGKCDVYYKRRQYKFSFLDVEVIREQGKFTTIIYRKSTFSGVNSNCERFLASVYKLVL